MKKLADKKSLSNVLLNCEFNYFSLSRPTYSRILFLIMFGLFGLIQMGYGNLGLHSLIIKTDGSLWTFGRNTYGQLGDGSSTHRRTPTQILSSGVARVSSGQYHSLIIKTDGSLWTFGRNAEGQLGDGTTVQRNTPTQILPSGVSQVSAGYSHSVILKTDGSVWTVGRNTNGQLGDGTTTNRNTLTQIISSGVVQVSAGICTL